MHALRDADTARRRQGLEALGDVYLVAVIAVYLFDDLAEIDADAKDRFVGIGVPDRVVAELALHLDRKADGLEGTVERRLDGVALNVEDTALVVADQGFEKVDAPHHAAVGTELVPLHRSAVVNNISKQNGRQALSYLVATRRGHDLKLPFPLIFRHLTTSARMLLEQGR